MDSGHPLFILFGDELALVCPARGYYASEERATGFLCAYYRNRIQMAVDGLSVSFGASLRKLEMFDPSVYSLNE